MPDYIPVRVNELGLKSKYGDCSMCRETILDYYTFKILNDTLSENSDTYDEKHLRYSLGIERSKYLDDKVLNNMQILFNMFAEVLNPEIKNKKRSRQRQKKRH